MLDKLITYIVCWYKTLYQVLPVAWTNRITTRSDPASHNRLDLIQSLVPTHYVCNGYICLSLFLSSVPVYFSWKWGHQCSMDTVFIFVLFEGLFGLTDGYIVGIKHMYISLGYYISVLNKPQSLNLTFKN